MPPKTSNKRVDDDVLAVLARMPVEGNILRPVSETLPRSLYERLAKVLEGMGGKWARGKGHVFADVPDLADRIEAVLATGDYDCRKTADQILGFFRTPEPLARQLAEEVFKAVGAAGMCLEPSAGDGRLVDALVTAGVPKSLIRCVEVDPKRVRTLRDKDFHVIDGDFLAAHDRVYHSADALFQGILMNPPFTRGADVKHVSAALKLRSGVGYCIRAIMSQGIKWRQDAPTKRLREYIKDLGGSIEDLPDGTFASEGTDVRACIVRIG